MHPDPETHCNRCGTCCRKGGPTLHREDLGLVTDGHISIAHLFTIRIGEPVRDDVRGVLTAAPGEMIKIKGVGTRWTCCFFEEDGNRCGIYDQRPVECRILDCKDTTTIERVYDSHRLTRKALLGHIEGLWELVAAHQARCDYRQVAQMLAEQAPDTSITGSGQMAEIIRYDHALRAQIVKQGLAGAEMLDFIFGRPVADVVRDLKKFEMMRGI